MLHRDDEFIADRNHIFPDFISSYPSRTIHVLPCASQYHIGLPSFIFAKQSRSRLSSRHLSSLHKFNQPRPIKYGTSDVDCSRHVRGRGVPLRVRIASLQDEGGALQRGQEAHNAEPIHENMDPQARTLIYFPTVSKQAPARFV